MFCWYGGKWKLKSLICEELAKAFKYKNDIEIYCEPFLGGASVFYEVKRKLGDKFKKFILNDINSNIINFYRLIQKGKLCNFPLRCEYSYFLKFRDKYIKEKDPCAYVYLVKCSYGCKPNEANFLFTSPDVLKNKKTSFLYINKKLEVFRDDRVILLNEDYKNVLKKFDAENVLYYFDPPFYETDIKPYDTDFNHEEFFNIIKKLKGLWLMSNSTDVKKFFNESKYYFKKITTQYGVDQEKKEFEQILISNYPIN